MGIWVAASCFSVGCRVEGYKGVDWSYSSTDGTKDANRQLRSG